MAALEPAELELAVSGMDCAECAAHLRSALASVPGVEDVSVSLALSKAVLKVRPGFDLEAARRAVEAAGYSISELAGPPTAEAEPFLVRRYRLVVAGVFAVVASVALAEYFGLLEALTALLPWPVWLLLTALLGYPSFVRVVRAALAGRVLSHTLMTVGAVAAMLVGQWTAALLMVAFMRLGSYVEGSVTARARSAVKGLAALMPCTARVVRSGQELELPVEQVLPGDIVVVRPGERIPVDGQVVWGRAEVDRSTVTGEAVPAEAGPGSRVYASFLVYGGVLKVRAERTGDETAYGQAVRLVQEAEGNRGSVALWADRFSAYYLPAVGAVGLAALVVRGDPLAMAAVMAVACSCSFALAAPLAQLAAIGAAARMGVVVRGGRCLELLASVNVVLVDKTGTVTFGRPAVADVVPTGSFTPEEVLSLAASAEKYSSHPLGRAVVEEARRRGLYPADPQSFSEEPGLGVRASVGGLEVVVGRAQARGAAWADLPRDVQGLLEVWDAEGKSAMLVWVDGCLAGALSAEDALRPEVPEAVAALKRMGLEVLLITGDRDAAAARAASALGVDYCAGVLPHEKVELVREHQATGQKVVMVGDGINDAAALAQADVGIAVADAGVALAAQAAPVVLLSDNWMMVPSLIHLARRAQGTVKLNIGFTALYNLVGVGLAFWGLLPPTVAAAAQSLPDVAILANSSRLLGRGRGALPL